MSGRGGSPRIPKDIRDLAEAAEAAGWKITRAGNNHSQWESPAGIKIIMSSSPGTKRNRAYALWQLRQAGLNLTVGRPPKKKSQRQQPA